MADKSIPNPQGKGRGGREGWAVPSGGAVGSVAPHPASPRWGEETGP